MFMLFVRAVEGLHNPLELKRSRHLLTVCFSGTQSLTAGLCLSVCLSFPFSLALGADLCLSWHYLCHL